jgi:hypothetical protein
MATGPPERSSCPSRSGRQFEQSHKPPVCNKVALAIRSGPAPAVGWLGAPGLIGALHPGLVPGPANAMTSLQVTALGLSTQ